MKTLEFDLGGRPIANDDLVTLQSETTASVAALYLGRGAFIVSGCQVSGSGPSYNVSAGIVFLDGQLLRFYGAGSVTLPMQLQRGGYDFLDQRTYQVGGTKTCIRERVAVLVDADPSYTGGEFIPFDTWGGLRWDHVMRASVRYLGEIAPLASVGYVPTDYDADGRGLPGTSAWGWHECNGSGGTDNYNGRVLLGRDANKSAYDTVGKQGGAETHRLTVPEMPSHRHTSERFARYQDFKALPNTGGDNAVRDRGYVEEDPMGGDLPHNNMQPFSTVLMRQWVGYV
ncbi:phage baseplate protein [Hymenobacter negativus]|uniref:Baseplate structural protein Gp10 C-terminal domain-containing protein n=1 Tax=Hymenobacter negativus TaxID=2795026 RepID=A0ABS3QDU4_9BACT|nr:hypothetical protein [Hymenobacter negativus]MBO2009158.1 hypothetical protein [Hymenobacter negativus]